MEELLGESYALIFFTRVGLGGGGDISQIKSLIKRDIIQDGKLRG